MDPIFAIQEQTMAISISPGKSINDFNVIIEISANAGEVKYEYNKELGLLSVDRFMKTAMRYPCNYGFVPNTLSEDGDPVDVLVETPYPIQPGTLIRVRAVGLLKMIDEAGGDSKILAVPIPKLCSEYEHIESLKDMPEVLLNRINHFFLRYKELEPNKSVTIEGWADKVAAEKEFLDSIQRFEKNRLEALRDVDP
jgi:inorganic pyrophosphatase